jgi:hypothetical protein
LPFEIRAVRACSFQLLPSLVKGMGHGDETTLPARPRW